LASEYFRTFVEPPLWGGGLLRGWFLGGEKKGKRLDRRDLRKWPGEIKKKSPSPEKGRIKLPKKKSPAPRGGIPQKK